MVTANLIVQWLIEDDDDDMSVKDFLPPKLVSVRANGRLWFNKICGNSYHSVEVYVNGKFLEKVPYAYGAGHMYEHSAMGVLRKHALIPQDTAHSSSLHFWCRKNGVECESDLVSVKRKRDL